MAVFEVTSRVTRRSLMNKSKDQLASRVLELMDLLDRERARRESEVAALQADKARLDFLDRCNAALNAHYGTNYGWELILSHNITRLLLGEFWAGEPRGLDLNDAAGGHAKLPSCRAAIDAKMPKRTRDADLPAVVSAHA